MLGECKVDGKSEAIKLLKLNCFKNPCSLIGYMP
jgi:hypothetical protein